MSSQALALDSRQSGGLSSPTSSSSRASLLSGLRTGGVRSPSPSPLMEQQMQQQQHHQQQRSEEGSPSSSFSPSAYQKRLKASAAIFTPNSPFAQKILNGQDQIPAPISSNVGNNHQGSPKSSVSNASHHHNQGSPQGSPVNQNGGSGVNRQREREMQALEDQMVAMRMQALAEQNAQSVAAMYGAARGQPNHELQQLRLQQQQQQQVQLEILRLQALQQHQQQQAALAAQQQQQQHLLAQIHAEYERQMANERGDRGSPQEQQHIFGGNSEVNSASSAQEQRQAAQASIQASLRNRSDCQAQQAQLQQREFYLAMLQQQAQQAQQAQTQQGGYTQEEMMQVQQMLMLQHQREQEVAQQQWMAQQLAQQQAESRSSGTPPSVSASPPPSNARNWRSSNTNGNKTGTASPAQAAQTGKRDRVASSADKSTSWRNKGANPSIVIDDSASDSTDGHSGMSQSDSENQHGEGDATPETSEEDLNVKTPLRKKSNKEAQGFGKGVPTPTQASHALGEVLDRNITQPIHFVQPRAISLAAAPRHRAFAEASTHSAASTPVQPRRQPKGPPTEFKEINFAARISARTRREAVNRLNKLCKSPRTVAAFRNVSAPVA